MKSLLIPACVLCMASTALSASAFPPEVKTYSEKEAKKFLKNLNQEWAKKSASALLARWEYEESITSTALERMLKTLSDVARYRRQQRKEVIRYPKDKIADADVRRQLERFSRLGPDGLSDEKYARFQTYVAELGVAPSCAEDGCRNPSGNVADLTDVGSVLLRDLERPDGNGGNAVEKHAEDLSTKLAPLYEMLHKYWRSRLHSTYRDASPPNQPILDHFREAPVCDADPIPNKPLDLSGAMRSKGFTKRRLVEMAAEFFSSLNMSAMPDSLWTLSLLEKETNRTIPCYSSAVDLLDNKDYRIRLCGHLEGETLVTAAVLVGRVVAAMELRPLAGVYRSPDPVVADAAGVLAALSLLSPPQLRQAGLLAGDDSAETAVNVLHQVTRALVAPAMRSLAADLWRLRASRAGPNAPLNAMWWDLVLKIEGVQPPINRTEKDFDAASVAPLLADPLATPLRTTLGMALGFQLHSVLCQQAGQFDPQEPERMPLHQCNLYGSPVASKALKRLLLPGFSQPWPAALKDALTVSASPATVDEFAAIATAPPSADPILKYFQPLTTWLMDTLSPNGETLTFGAPDFACPVCRRVLSSNEARSPASHIHQCHDGGESEDEPDEIALTTSSLLEGPSSPNSQSASTEVTSKSSATG